MTNYRIESRPMPLLTRLGDPHFRCRNRRRCSARLLFRNPFWETWSRKNPDKFVIVPSAKTYVGREANCSMGLVSQTAGRRGSIYSAQLRLKSFVVVSQLTR